MERIAFADLSLAFDDAAAQAFRLYQAAFKRAPEVAGLGFWIKALDSGMPLADVAGYFVASPEFSALYGDKPGNATLVEGFYLNALNRPGDADGLKFWSDLLDSKSICVAEMLVYFSESPENQLQTADIVGAGLPFIPLI